MQELDVSKHKLLQGMDFYEQVFKLAPDGNPDRAMFYRKRAACPLHVKSVNYDNVGLECTLTLDDHPKFGKALFRRARAYEAMGKFHLAHLLHSESNNPDASEVGKRLRVALGNKQQIQQDSQWHTSVFTAPTNTPASPGAESGVHQGGRGPSLPARPSNKKQGRSGVDSELTLGTAGEDGSELSSGTLNISRGLDVKEMMTGTLNLSRGPEMKEIACQGQSLGDVVVSPGRKGTNKKQGRSSVDPKLGLRTAGEDDSALPSGNPNLSRAVDMKENSNQGKSLGIVVVSPGKKGANRKQGRSNVDPKLTLGTAGEDGSALSSGTANLPRGVDMKENSIQGQSLGTQVVSARKKVARKKVEPGAETKQAMRQLKLIFGDDIRRAEIPVNCGFGQLREAVRKRFPALKACLIKYQDMEGNLVAITNREDIRSVEVEFEAVEMAKRQSAAESPVDENIPEGFRIVDKLQVQLSKNSPELLRLHIVEVSPEQETPVPEDDDVVNTTEDLIKEKDLAEDDDVVNTTEDLIKEQDLAEDDDVVNTTEDLIKEQDLAEEATVDEFESRVESAGDPTENGIFAKARLDKALKSIPEDGQLSEEEMETRDWIYDFPQLFRTHYEERMKTAAEVWDQL